MSPVFRRSVAGPFATTAMAGSLWLLDRLGYSVPAPGALVLATVVYATWVGGLFSGYASAGCSSPPPCRPPSATRISSPSRRPPA